MESSLVCCDYLVSFVVLGNSPRSGELLRRQYNIKD
jgi:hypothetical protein